ncbi:MAG TPA: tetratricopeptide repeat protein [Terriglobales bacterium]|nr:tetratricopeptide repeat protein [Terriglobales bacterium]
MRAETRHQLKEDRFSKATLQAAEKTVDWTVEHKSKLVVAAIVVAVAALAGFGGWYYIGTQDEKASSDLGAATRLLDQPIRPAGTPADPAIPSYASAQERATEARKKFQAIVDQYPHTRTSDVARYFVGLTSSQLGDNAAAERNLQEVAGSSNKDLAALAKLALASLYLSENKGAQAVDIYKLLIDKPTAAVSKVTAQLQLAQLYESQQKPDEAKRVYDQIQKENPATDAAQLAQQRASKLK